MSSDDRARNADDRERASGDLLRLGAPAALLLILGFGVAYWFVDPAPPAKIVIATGEAGGAYARFGERYAARLVDFEIDVELQPTAGTAESLAALGRGEVDAAFVQGGVARAGDGASLESLGSLYYEPLWVFHREAVTLDRLSDLAGRRVAVGPPGSGTRAVAVELLARNGADVKRFEGGVSESADALLAGAVDAVFLIASPEADVVRRLLLADGVRPFSFRRAEAYTRTHRFLSHVTLPEGMIDYAENVPAADVELVAPTAQLVVRAGLHPALIDLLVQSADAIHGDGGVFEAPGDFPTPDFIDQPLNAEAARFYAHGPPFLQRYLPFWLATLLDRLKVMLIPLVALLIPVFRLFPPLYRWRVRSRIYRWYKELREIDPRNRSDFDVEQAIADAQRIEGEIAEVEAPPSYGEELYQLRLHLEFVQAQLAERESATPPTEPDA